MNRSPKDAPTSRISDPQTPYVTATMERGPLLRSSYHVTDAERPAIKAAYLAALRKTGLSYHSAESVGVVMSTISRWRDQDPDFDAACSERWNHHTDSLEIKMLDKTDEKGMPGVIATLATLKKRRPQEWSEKHIIVPGAGLGELADLFRAVKEEIAKSRPRAQVIEGTATELPAPPTA